MNTRTFTCAGCSSLMLCLQEVFKYGLQKNLSSICACMGIQMSVFIFRPVVMTFSPLPSVGNFCKYLNTQMPCPYSYTRFYNIPSESPVSEGKVSQFFVYLFLIPPLWQNFPLSLWLPFQSVTYLSQNKLLSFVYLSTYSCQPWLIHLYFYFAPSMYGWSICLSKGKISRSPLNVITFFCNNNSSCISYIFVWQ